MTGCSCSWLVIKPISPKNMSIHVTSVPTWCCRAVPGFELFIMSLAAGLMYSKWRFYYHGAEVLEIRGDLF